MAAKKNKEQDPLVSAVMNMMASGKDRETIARELSTRPETPGVEGGGVAQLEAMFPDYDTALNTISPVYDKLIDDARKEIVTGAELGWGWVGGAVAAIIGAVIWSVVIVVTESEVGVIALGIGLLCGYAVHATARMKRSRSLQAAAVVTSITSIAMGKYFAFWWFLRKFLVEEHGQEVAEQVKLLSAGTISLLFENTTLFFGPYDILWVILAVSIAWKIPRPAGLLKSFSGLPEIQTLR